MPLLLVFLMVSLVSYSSFKNVLIKHVFNIFKMFKQYSLDIHWKWCLHWWVSQAFPLTIPQNSVFLHPWLTCCLAKTKHLSMPSLEQCMWWTDRWYTSAKSLLVFPNVPQMAWTEPWTESMNTPALDTVWTLPSSSWTFSMRCNFIQNLTILYLWNMSSSDRIGWKGTTNRRCI